MNSLVLEPFRPRAVVFAVQNGEKQGRERKREGERERRRVVGRDARRQFAGVANYKARYESVERFRIFSSFQFSSPSSASSLFLLLSSLFIYSIFIYLKLFFVFVWM